MASRTEVLGQTAGKCAYCIFGCYILLRLIPTLTYGFDGNNTVIIIDHFPYHRLHIKLMSKFLAGFLTASVDCDRCAIEISDFPRIFFLRRRRVCVVRYDVAPIRYRENGLF